MIIDQSGRAAQCVVDTFLHVDNSLSWGGGDVFSLLFPANIKIINKRSPIQDKIVACYLSVHCTR